jgi:hypothetical protein
MSYRVMTFVISELTIRRKNLNIYQRRKRLKDLELLKINIFKLLSSRDSAVGIATGYGLDD